jgi:hypothetical protein
LDLRAPVEGGVVGAEPNTLQGFTGSSTTRCPEGARSFVITVEASALAEGARKENMRTGTITSEPESLARELKVVSGEEWIAARMELLKKEEELTNFRAQLTSERKELMSMKNCTQPWKGNDGQRITRDLEELSTKFGERNDCGNNKEFVSQQSVYTHNFTLRISRLLFRKRGIERGMKPTFFLKPFSVYAHQNSRWHRNPKWRLAFKRCFPS